MFTQFFFEFGELNLHCVQAEVDSFLEGVGSFLHVESVAGNHDIETCGLVQCRCRFLNF